MSKKNNSENGIAQDFKKNNFTKYQWAVVITAISITGFFLRMYYSPFEIPIILDGLLFFWYANDISILGTLPLDYSPANNGWPIFLSLFFHVLDSNNFMDYMVIQRLVSIILSVLTIIPIYYLGRKFFSQKYAFVGSAIFAFEPRIIQNSFLGVSESLFILLVTVSIVCFLSKRKEIVFLSFPIISLATIVRSEAIVMIIPFTVMYIIKFKNSKKAVLQTPILIFVFILIILPISTYKVEVNGSDGILSRIPDLNLDASKSITIQKESQTEELQNIFTLIGLASIPIFIFLVPYGFFRIFQKKKFESVEIMVILFFLSIPAIYSISFLPDTKYLYVLYPILCIISIFSIKKFSQYFSHKNLVIVVILSLILISSISFLEIKKTDKQHIVEVLEIAEIISGNTKITNQFPPESGYLPILGMKELEEFPILRSEFVNSGDNMKYCFNIHNCDYFVGIMQDEKLGIKEFLIKYEQQGISHLVVDDKEERRAKFIEKIFQNENEFKYLTKIYDSKEHNFEYNVKIFEIDYEEFKEGLR
ncbi:hypothetical protein Nisw_04340 [Candidatus Nitrosopumilus sp. SW]|uniref:glycosyltransferase family 39 protein n=1 Tax=Candidatus Nitrosopumilus sp. SW TaxID=2508726 RepID=UPI00114D56CC|nr:glycosyltransferase family 39 protein [Candidatus Nitrosopumilus sp. SW]QDI88804.1 hypothetical protein Nisw_04340 [Candidatus Nitrosopumilus sp. SW]